MSAKQLQELIRAVSVLSKNQAASLHNLDSKFVKMEKEVAASQEDTTERAIKRATRDRPLEYKKKGHKEQYYFNAEVGDRMEAAAKKMKVTLTSDKETP